MDLKEAGIVAVIMAAGKGTRMKSDIPKVLHKINGQTMINLVIQTVYSILKKNVIVVIGHKADMVKNEIESHFEVTYAFQNQLLGTGDAVKTAVPFLKANIQHILILCGDVPLIKALTIKNFISYHLTNYNDLSLFGVTLDIPAGYGRIILNSRNEITAIREEADADLEEKKIKTINAGLYCVKKEFLLYSLAEIRMENAQKEYYLTDLAEIAFKNNRKTGCFIGDDPQEVVGVNTIEELKKAEKSALIH